MGVCASKHVCGGASSENRCKPDREEADTQAYYQKHSLEDTNKPLKIQIKSGKTAHEATPTSYNIAGRTKGAALIINNAGEECRKSSEVDVKNVAQLLKAIKIKPKIVNNLKAKEMHKSVESFAKNCKPSDVDLCIIVIIGNVKCIRDGNKLVEIGGSDNAFSSVEDIIEHLSDEKCPQLKGKPKFFLFHGHFYDTSDVRPDYSMKLSLKDMFIANAVLTGNMQKQKFASYYIQALCYVFMDDVYDKDLESLIQKVEEMVYNHDRSTQHTHYDNLFFKKCYIRAS